MARKIEFDYDKAIERATRLFWKNGYSNTSLRDLLKVMKIGEGSFYNTLKSKKNLYLECLKYYRNTEGRRREDALYSAPTAKLGVRAMFKIILDGMDDPSTGRACLMASSMCKEVFKESDLRQYIEGEMASSGAKFVGMLMAAQKAGELPKDCEPAVIAQLIGVFLQGLRRMAMISYDRPRFERLIDAFLTALQL